MHRKVTTLRSINCEVSQHCCTDNMKPDGPAVSFTELATFEGFFTNPPTTYHVLGAREQKNPTHVAVFVH